MSLFYRQIPNLPKFVDRQRSTGRSFGRVQTVRFSVPVLPADNLPEFVDRQRSTGRRSGRGRGRPEVQTVRVWLVGPLPGGRSVSRGGCRLSPRGQVSEQGRMQDFSQGWAPSDGLVLECY